MHQISREVKLQGFKRDIKRGKSTPGIKRGRVARKAEMQYIKRGNTRYINRGEITPDIKIGIVARFLKKGSDARYLERGRV